MLCIFCVGVLIIVSLSCYTGLLIYATYHDCDRVSTKVCPKLKKKVSSPIFLLFLKIDNSRE